MKTEYDREDFMIIEPILTIKYTTKILQVQFDLIIWSFANSEWKNLLKATVFLVVKLKYWAIRVTNQLMHPSES